MIVCKEGAGLGYSPPRGRLCTYKPSLSSTLHQHCQSSKPSCRKFKETLFFSFHSVYSIAFKTGMQNMSYSSLAHASLLFATSRVPGFTPVTSRPGLVQPCVMAGSSMETWLEVKNQKAHQSSTIIRAASTHQVTRLLTGFLLQCPNPEGCMRCSLLLAQLLSNTLVLHPHRAF